MYKNMFVYLDCSFLAFTNLLHRTFCIRGHARLSPKIIHEMMNGDFHHSIL